MFHHAFKSLRAGIDMNQRTSGKVSTPILLASVAIGLAMGALVPASPDVGAAWAQEDGHEGGGGGKGDKGKGGRHGKPVPPVVQPVVAAGDGIGTGTGGAVRSLGKYVRLELGAAFATAGDASWLPPGYPADPQVFFDLDGDTSAVAAIGLGRDYGNGWRGEVSLNLFGKSSFDGPWSYTVPATAGPHAGVEGSVRSLAVMANAYRDFDTGGKVTPFVTVGLGLARNTMGEWTRMRAGRAEASRETARPDLPGLSAQAFPGMWGPSLARLRQSLT
ncbi:MAG: outer membrane protein [Tabrizicola sp.]